MTDVVVIGAGVVGLTVGVCLREAGIDASIVASLPPAETTSVLATAMVSPTFGFGGAEVDGWAERSAEVVAADVDRLPGAHVCRGRFVSRLAGMIPPAAADLPGYSVCAPDELPDGFESGWWADVPLIDMPPYLAGLDARFRAAGGDIEIRRLGSLDEAVALAPVVVNCSGLGAAELVPDPQVKPWRGPKIVVENPGLDTFLIEGPPGARGTSIHPHGDIAVLGGSTIESDDTTPDPAELAEIVERCVEVEPRLRGARVVEHRVGLRPGRPEVRFETERRGDATILHNYGHGGMGVALSWGTALEITRLVQAG